MAPGWKKVKNLPEIEMTDFVTDEEVQSARKRGMFEDGLTDEQIRTKLLEIKEFAIDYAARQAASRDKTEAKLSDENMEDVRSDDEAQSATKTTTGSKHIPMPSTSHGSMAPPPVPLPGWSITGKRRTASDGTDHSAKRSQGLVPVSGDPQTSGRRSGLDHGQPSGPQFNPLHQHPIDPEAEWQAYEQSNKEQ